MNQLVVIHKPALPALVAAAGEALACASSNSSRPTSATHTRRAYSRAVGDFLAWCEVAGVPSIAAVEPLYVASYIEELTRERSAPTAKQRLIEQ